MTTQCSQTAITELMWIAWRTVGAIVRVWADVEAVHDRFVDPKRFGIGEIAYKRGQRYLTVRRGRGLDQCAAWNDGRRHTAYA